MDELFINKDDAYKPMSASAKEVFFTEKNNGNTKHSNSVSGHKRFHASTS